jgi:Xaa-Pro aminopeptidase
MRSSGFSKPAFDTIVGSGPNGALPHATAGERAIQRGDLVVLDFGGVLDGYCVDMTRTVSVGPPGPEARRVYQAVRAAQRAAIEAVRPGVPTDEIDAAARSVLDRAGLGGAFGHGTGHGLGLEVHEDPRITRRARGAGATAGGPVAVAAGMVFTIEPGAYLPDWGGVRIEDDVLVTEEGCEVLTRGADVDGPFFST